MTPTRLLLALALIGAVAGCEKEIVPSVINGPRLHAEPPEGYKVICDGKGDFTFQTPNGYIAHRFVSHSRQEAINDAWFFAAPERPEPVDTHDWKICDEAKSTSQAAVAKQSKDELDKVLNTGPTATFTTNHIEWVAMPPTHHVLTIHRPWIKIGQATVIRLTDEEWELLKVEYADKLENADEKTSIEFYADDKPGRAAKGTP